MKKGKWKQSVLSSRDLRTLLFIWNWKISPTIAIAQKFFPKANPITAYNRLLKLKNDDYLEVQVDVQGRNPVWTLTKRGFSAIREFLPPLKEEGFRSENRRHDLIVMAVHLGDFVGGQPENVSIITEQFLRRVDEEYIPSWIPESRSRRPDGFWHIDNGNDSTTIALEVELNRKNSADYKDMAMFYMCSAKIQRVLWLTSDLNMARRIHSHIVDLDASDVVNHSFITLNDFKKSGWQSQVTIGASKDKTINDVLCGNPHGNLMESSWDPMGSPLLDTRLYSLNSATYKKPSLS